MENSISDQPPRSPDLVDTAIIAYTEITYPHRSTWILITLLSTIISAIASALRQTTFMRVSLLAKPPPIMYNGRIRASSAERWTSTPYLSHTWIQSLSSISSPGSIELGKNIQANLKYSLEQSRTPYSRLARRSSLWEPRTPNSQAKYFSYLKHTLTATEYY